MDNQGTAPRDGPSKGVWVTKLVLRMAAAVSGIILIALTGALTSKYLTKASYYYSTPPVLVLAPQAGIAFVWAMVDGACLAFRRNHEGVHPGLVVVLDLLLWLGLIAGTILFSFMHYVSDPYYSDDYYDFDADDYDELSWVHDVGSAVLAFCCLSVVLHFTLFIFACIQVSRRNRPPRIVYYAAPMPMQYPMYSYQQQQNPYHPHPYHPHQQHQHQQPMYGYPSPQQQQPVFIPAGQVPPPGWIPVAYPPPPPPQQQQQQQQQQHEQQAAENNTHGISPPTSHSPPSLAPREPSPVDVPQPARADPGPSGTAN